MAVNVPRAKYRLRRAARDWNKAHSKDQIVIPRVRWAGPVWGSRAQLLALRYTAKVWPGSPRSRLDDRLLNHLFPNRAKPLKLRRVKLSWARPLVDRFGKPERIVWHHAAAKTCGVKRIHGWHLGLGYSGFAYQFLVRKSGSVYVGRPEGKCGGHTKGAPGTIGVCIEGNFDAERMTDKQLRGAQELHRYLHRKYGGVGDARHRDMPGNSTACPGRYMPFNEIVSAK